MGFCRRFRPKATLSLWQSMILLTLWPGAVLFSKPCWQPTGPDVLNATTALACARMTSWLLFSTLVSVTHPTQAALLFLSSLALL